MGKKISHSREPETKTEFLIRLEDIRSRLEKISGELDSELLMLQPAAFGAYWEWSREDHELWEKLHGVVSEAYLKATGQH